MTFATLPAMTVTWNDVTLGGGDTFLQWNVYRRLTGAATWTRIAVLSARSPQSYTDNTPASAQSYDYGVSVSVTRSSTTVEGPKGTATATLTFVSSFLHDVASPTNYAEVYANANKLQDNQDLTFLHTWGNQAPVAYVGVAQAKQWTITGVMAQTQPSLDMLPWTTFDALLTRQRVNGSVFCFRQGKRGDRMFCQIVLPKRSDVPMTYTPELDLQECKYTEAV